MFNSQRFHSYLICVLNLTSIVKLVIDLPWARFSSLVLLIFTALPMRYLKLLQDVISEISERVFTKADENIHHIFEYHFNLTGISFQLYHPCYTQLHGLALKTF